jgi:two-component system phosphate regulon sensor histidine kinase PhoR
MLESVLRECEYLNKLVNQLLVLVEAKADRYNRSRPCVRWDEFVRRCCDFYEALANLNQIQIEYSNLQPCSIAANPEHLRFVVHNIIDNAIKYSQAGGRIEIDLQNNTETMLCSLRVRDTGIGISKEDLERVGRRFFRSDSGRDPESTPRGTGLGLNIVKTIVESLRGELKIESEIGNGTTVTVLLPTVATTATEPITTTIDS